jgi:uncharacterized protein (DUF2235 family)
MRKRIALFFDGTWNLYPQQTNVARLHGTVVDGIVTDGLVDGQVRQIPRYFPGPGTDLHNFISGGFFGIGISKIIKEGYATLIDHYREGDEVYLFGFSRGAYIARSLVGLIRKCGLLREFDTPRLNEAYEIYRRRGEEDQRTPDTEEAVSFRNRYSQTIRIHFIGVWDTVGSLGIPAPFVLFNRSYYLFHNTGLSGIVDRAYHAVAIDERRPDFMPTLWTEVPRQATVEQCWFAGSHGNIGGGLGDGNPLADLALQWLQEKAGAAGLSMKHTVSAATDAHLGPITDSYREFFLGLYQFIRWTPHDRPIGQTTNETLHGSVSARRIADPSYRPKALERYLEAGGR